MASDFFQRQDNARKGTVWLLVMMGGAVLGIALIISVVLQWTLGTVGESSSTYPGGYQRQVEMQSPGLPDLSTFAFSLFGVGAIMGVASLVKRSQLSAGGSAVAEMLGGRLVMPIPATPQEKVLLNVVEEMSIASGVPVPRVYVLEDRSINAFAAGRTIDDATIGVTRGAMEQLTRDELQGVIAHEFSHILNGDMRMNTKLISIVFGLLVLAIVGRVAFRVGAQGGSSRDSKGANPILIIGLVFMIFGYIGVLFGNLIKAAVSRQREYLADASAVQFTRNPDGLAGALKKIASSGGAIKHPEAAELSHMFFADAMGGLFSTHPPIMKRIQALQPDFDGDLSGVVKKIVATRNVNAPPPPPLPGKAIGIPFGNAAAMVAAVGAPTSEHLAQTREFYDTVPETIRVALHEIAGAEAVVCALLMSHNPATRERQQAILQERRPKLAYLVGHLESDAGRVPPGQRLNVMDLAIPALRHLNPAQVSEFDGDVHAMIEADEQIDLFEYAVAALLRRHLVAANEPSKARKINLHDAKQAAPEIAVLVSALAHLEDSKGPQSVAAAFASGVQALNAPKTIQLLAAESCHLGAVDTALERLSHAIPGIKKNVIYACAAVVMNDGVVSIEQGELLRAMADAMDCPVPPFVVRRQREQAAA